MLLMWRTATAKQKRLMVVVIVGLAGLLLLCSFYFGGLQTLAAEGDIFEAVGNKFKEIYSGLSVVITALAGIAIAICAVKWIMGDPNSARAARQWLIWIVVGLALYWLAFLVIRTVQNMTEGYTPEELGF